MSRSWNTIQADIKRMRTWMALDQGDLGKDLCKAATDGVQECFATSTDPDGNKWDELSEPYATRKEFEYNGAPIGVRVGKMSDPREVAGETEVVAELAIVGYGLSDEARQEAAWFQEGNDNQPARGFWGITRSAEAEMDRIVERRFRAFK